MTEALAMAHLSAKDIQYVNAHGTGTPNNDLSESVSLKRVFGDKMPMVSSTKSFTGHTTSASGSIETVICLLAMQHHFVPANLGWKNPMEMVFFQQWEFKMQTWRMCSAIPLVSVETTLHCSYLCIQRRAQTK